MYSINFPKMFTSAKTLLVENHDAILSNLKLLLASDRTALFGDPYYGTELKKFIYEQNNSILKDLVIDEIYETIILFHLLLVKSLHTPLLSNSCMTAKIPLLSMC